MGFKWYESRVDDEREEVGRATWRATEFLLGEANKKVPHETGTLERSGIVTQDGLSGMPVTIYNQAKDNQWPKNNFKFDFSKKPIFYISYNTPYAIRLHENPQYDFMGKGEGKWLENAAKAMSGKISKWIAKEMK